MSDDLTDFTPDGSGDMSDFKPDTPVASATAPSSTPPTQVSNRTGWTGIKPGDIPVPTDVRTIPNPRIRNLPNPVDPSWSPGRALYEGAKTGITAASIPSATTMSLPALLRTAIGGTLGGVAAQKGAQLSGAGEFGQEVAGDVGSLAGGGLANVDYRLPIRIKNSLVDYINELTSPPPKPRPTRTPPAWQTAPQPTTEISLQGSTPEEIQAHLQRMAARKAQVQAKAELGANADITRINERAAEFHQQAQAPESPYQVVKVGSLPKPKGNPYAGARVPQAMTPAQSTTISLHGYHPESQTMVVQFKNGNVYEYRGVPQQVYDQYQQSESQGSFFANNIKGRYETNLRGQVKPSAGSKVKQALGGQPSNTQ